jgi:transcriptional regulator with XRE-family HTH domain
MPAGRPSKYDPAYCDQVEEAMAEGYSLTAFAGKIDVSRSTINEWMENHPEFSEAVSRAKAKRLLKWEEIGLGVARNGGGTGSATVVVFGLKNMGGDEWADVQRSEITGKDGAPIRTESQVDLSGLTADQLRALASIKLPSEA